MSISVLYEDNHIIIVEKPVNVPVQADDTGDIDLLTLVKAYIKEKYDKPGEVYCGLVHRLDRPVGGVMVFARTSKAASRLMPQFAQKANAGAKKRYAALVCGRAEPGARLNGFILRDEATHSSRIVEKDAEGAKPASLDYTRVSRRGGLDLLDIELHTGRHHQIRVQLANAGLPIWGDQRYNPAAVPGQQIALWAYSLEIEHPVKRERMRFTALPPESMGAWGGFMPELRGLAAGLPVVFCDDNVIVVNKPAGITVAEADGAGDTCEARLSAVFGPVFPVHRLDAVTSGLVIFARNEQAKAELDSAIRERKLKKSYLAVTVGAPRERSGRLSLYAVKDAGAGFVRVYDRPQTNGLEMITDYSAVGSSRGLTLIRADLVTGRTHQIRASLAHIGCPILGDDRYGSREANRDPAFRALHPKGSLCLCACEIGFAFGEGSPLAYLNGKSLRIDPPFAL